MTYYYIFCACGENVGKNRANKKAKYLFIKYLAFYLVPRPGVEPGWMLLHWCLRPARLPIPPSGQLEIVNCQIIGHVFSKNIVSPAYHKFLTHLPTSPKESFLSLSGDRKLLCINAYFCSSLSLVNNLPWYSPVSVCRKATNCFVSCSDKSTPTSYLAIALTASSSVACVPSWK